MSAAEHLREAIDVGCTRDDHDHVADHRAEVLREAGGIADQLIAAVPHTDPDGLAKVDAYRAYSDRLHEIADCGELAGKDTGGAPAGESTQPAPAPDFFQPGHTYTDPTPAYDWQFRCDTVTIHPDTGERVALGWRRHRGEWEPYAYDEADYSINRLAGTSVSPTEGGDRRD